MSREHPFKKYLKGVKRHLIDMWWQLRGPTFKNPPLPSKVSSIVFICKGNICRSVFAHYLALQNSGECSIFMNFHVGSAGLTARSGEVSPAMAIQAAKSFNLDLQDHRARRLTQDLVETADMLIAMEPWQMRALQKQYPEKKLNIFLLPFFVDGWDRKYQGWQRYHIRDPYGKGLEEFVESFGRVKDGVEGLASRLP